MCFHKYSYQSNRWQLENVQSYAKRHRCFRGYLPEGSPSLPLSLSVSWIYLQIETRIEFVLQ